ncbi:hypothetical protein GPALN_004872 [Globodera pallida]|nr:hypothetical protein GPALN_004872 [Globodera pallida]
MAGVPRASVALSVDSTSVLLGEVDVGVFRRGSYAWNFLEGEDEMQLLNQSAARNDDSRHKEMVITM